MKKLLKTLLRRAAAILVAGSLAAGSVPAFADSPAAGTSSGAAGTELGRVSGTWTLDMWHYSGGYWKVGNVGSEAIRVEDRDITALDSYLQANNRAVFTVDAPVEIVQLVREGGRGTDWQVTFANYRWRDCSLLFAESSPETITVKGDAQLEFSATPIFHFNQSGASLRDYVPGMSVTVPLVDKTYGCNIYSVFGNGLSAVQGRGYYNEADPADLGNNAIHPSMILSTSGALEAGHPITLKGQVVDSAGYSIGSGTFAAAGACGLHFEFPVSLVFTDLRTPDPGEAPGGDDPGSGGDPGGDDPPGDPTDPTEDPNSVTSVQACLELPQTAYTGHDVAARDESTYVVDGQTIGAGRAIELGLGHNSFSIVQSSAGHIRKTGRTGAIAVFDRPGTFQVKLTETAEGGLKSTDTKSIRILQTPAVLADLGGVQKENRKQSLIVTVAQDPRHPVDELTIVLKDQASGESVSVSKVFGSEEAAPANSAHIKLRSLRDAGSDAYYLCVALDFLTKWHEERTLSYEIQAKDSAGNTDEASGEFRVAPDLPPAAAIDLEDTYYRREGGGAASITVGCATETDGDALRRSWQVKVEGGDWQDITAMPGYRDLSFGTGRQVKFDKAGVGPFAVRLTVRDLWTEETLPEYVTEADHLTASAEKTSRVDNIAPRVSLDLLRTESAQILVLTDTDRLRQDVLAAAPSLKAALLAEGIAADVHADLKLAKESDETGALTELTTGGHGAMDLRGSDRQLHYTYFKGMWDGGNLVCDGRYSYLLSPSVQVYPADPEYSIHTYPFTLSARDADGQVVWTTSVTRSILDSQTELRDAVWGFDADGTYLYLMDSGKTALFDARTGTYAATLNVTLGTFNLVTQDYIYAFKDSGIYRMPAAGGALTCVYAADLSCPVYLSGGVQFLMKADLGKGLGLYRGTFDPDTGKVRCTLFEGSLSGYARDAQGLAIDAKGAVFAVSGSSLYCFGPDDLLIRRMDLYRSLDKTSSICPVWSGDGQVRYVAQCGTLRSSDRREVWCRVYSPYTGETFADSRSKADDYPNLGKPVVFAAEDKNGAVGVYLGCGYAYATGERYLDTVLFSLNGTFRNPFGFSMEHGYQSIRYICATANLNATADLKQIVRVAENRADEDARLRAKHLSQTKNYSYVMTLEGSQTPEALAAALDGAANALKTQKAQGAQAAVLTGQGSLRRSVSLAPDTTYYYKYDTSAQEDIFSVEAVITRPEGMPETDLGYRVTAAHAENFDDAAVDRFFTVDATAIRGGRYRIGYLKTKESSGGQAQSGTSFPVRFTVPEGYQAVFSTDYAFECHTAEPFAKQLFLTRTGGETAALDIPAGVSRGSGTYVHASLLSAGTYTLDCALRDRVKNTSRESSFWLDNLKIMLVQESAAQESAGWQPLQTSSSVSGGAMCHVTGSFTTPQQVMHFAAYPCQRVTGVNNEYTETAEEMRGYTKTLTLDLNLPEGKTALYAVLTGTGRGGSYTASSGSTRYYDARWMLDEQLLGVNTIERNGVLQLYALPENVRFAWKGLDGAHTVKASANTNYGANVSFSDLRLYVSEAGSVPPALREGRFFEANNALYAEDLVYSGASRIRFAADSETAVRNLHIYAVSGQTEETAYACRFHAEDELALWEEDGLTASIGPFAAESEEPARVYAKGETIQYQVFYGDHEHDPSKKQHWVYTHEPLTDGLWPQAGQDLSAPVTKFYVDGKYTAVHWQEDSTGNAAYDKESNKVEITFYISSGPGNGAPWVKDIRTEPSPVKAGNSYTVKASVDDKEKEPLTVTVEVYKDQGSRPVGAKTVKDLKPNAAGNYPDVVLSGLPKAEAGTYDVVVTVKDEAGADVKTLRFQVKEDRTLTGTVTHTAAWEANRLAWNEAKQGTDAVRPPNMFWPGEVLVLNAPCTGQPVSVDAQLLQFPQYAARLTQTGAAADGKPLFTGTLWHSSMLTTIGTARPVPATVRFTARYQDGSALTWDVAIIFDQSYGSYYQLHRTY